MAQDTDGMPVAPACDDLPAVNPDVAEDALDTAEAISENITVDGGKAPPGWRLDRFLISPGKYRITFARLQIRAPVRVHALQHAHQHTPKAVTPGEREVLHNLVPV